jgi:UDP-GlcNAc:undecaprenyl-phosphate/decaprenyl-phosphate GlcNAc-1-phosphate transferase
VRDYALTLLVAAAVTYVLTPLVRRFAIAVGAIKQPRERDVHTAPVPEFGGLAMYAGLAAALFVANEISQLHDDAIAGTGMLTGLLGAGGVLVIIGLIDDRWGLSALTKAAGQVAAAGILVATGSELSWLPLPGGSGRIFIPSSDEGALLTILIVVATINAVNFIDGLDGLAAGIVAIAAVSFFAYYYSLTKLIDISSLAAPALASAVLIGMCLGFLPHNFAPAKIFMGDTGAMLLGLVLAYAPISSINSLPAPLLEYSINRYPVIMPVLLPMVLLVIPYGDMLLAVVRRTRAGQSPFAADRKHLHHRLLDIGHSQRASVLIMYLWAAAFSGIVVWLSIDKTELPKADNHYGEPVIVFVLITAIAVAILLLLSMPWRHWREQARNGAAAARAAAMASMRPEGALAGRGNGVSGVNSRPDTGPPGAAAPARSALLSGSGPPAVSQGDGRERVAGGDGLQVGAGQQAAPEQFEQDDEAGSGYPPGDGTSAPRPAGDGAGPALGRDSAAGAELGAGNGGGQTGWHDRGGSADSDAGDTGSREQADDGSAQDTRNEVSGGAGWPGVGRGDGEPASRAPAAEFGSGTSDGPSAAGAVPPSVSDGDWAWFQPTAGSLPDVGRSRES